MINGLFVLFQAEGVPIDRYLPIVILPEIDVIGIKAPVTHKKFVIGITKRINIQTLERLQNVAVIHKRVGIGSIVKRKRFSGTGVNM